MFPPSSHHVCSNVVLMRSATNCKANRHETERQDMKFRGRVQTVDCQSARNLMRHADFTVADGPVESRWRCCAQTHVMRPLLWPVYPSFNKCVPVNNSGSDSSWRDSRSCSGGGESLSDRPKPAPTTQSRPPFPRPLLPPSVTSDSSHSCQGRPPTCATRQMARRGGRDICRPRQWAQCADRWS